MLALCFPLFSDSFVLFGYPSSKDRRQATLDPPEADHPEGKTLPRRRLRRLPSHEPRATGHAGRDGFAITSG